MIFEVDNTTKKLIEELNGSIQDTIKALQDSQNELKNLIGEAGKKCIDEVSSREKDFSEKYEKLISLLKETAKSDKLDEQKGITEKLRSEVQTIPNKEYWQNAKSDLDAAQNTLLSEIKALPNAEKIQSLLSCYITQKELIDVLSKENERLSTSLLEAYSKQEEELLKKLNDRFTEVMGQLTSTAKSFDTELHRILDAQNGNLQLLRLIAGYLAMPGYKRFFKGMEMPSDDIAEK